MFVSGQRQRKKTRKGKQTKKTHNNYERVSLKIIVSAFLEPFSFIGSNSYQRLPNYSCTYTTEQLVKFLLECKDLSVFDCFVLFSQTQIPIIHFSKLMLTEKSTQIKTKRFCQIQSYYVNSEKQYE